MRAIRRVTVCARCSTIGWCAITVKFPGILATENDGSDPLGIMTVAGEHPLSCPLFVTAVTKYERATPFAMPVITNPFDTVVPSSTVVELTQVLLLSGSEYTR